MAIPRSLSDGGDNKTGTSTAYPGSRAGFLHGQTCYPQSQYFNTIMRNILEIKQKSLAGMSDDEIKAYLEEQGFGWRDWYFNRVPMPSNIIENLAFWKKTSVYVDNVSLEDVIGHNHGSVSSDLNWITLLSSLNRHKYDCDTQSILKMLREQDQIPDSSDSLILLYKYGSCYFFSLGRHRVVQAKFLELDSIHCAVWEFVFDQHAYDLYRRIQAHAKIVDGEKWKPGQPVKATIDNIHFEVPLTDEAVEILERAVLVSQKISKIPVYRKFIAHKGGPHEKEYPFFNLGHTTSHKAVLPALLRSIIKNNDASGTTQEPL